MSGEELQELSQQLQVVESQLEALQTEVQTLRARKQNIAEAIDAIGTLESDSTVQVPVGGEAYVRATVEDIDEVLVGIGGGYATEQSQSDAADLLEEKQSLLDDRISELTEVITNLQAQGEQLGQRAQQHLQEQQQNQQLQGGQPGRLDDM